MNYDEYIAVVSSQENCNSADGSEEFVEKSCDCDNIQCDAYQGMFMFPCYHECCADLS